MKILVAVDGSKSSQRAVAHVIQSVAGREGVELNLINVQAPVVPVNVRRFVSREMIENYRRELGDKALGAACRMLERAKVSYEAHLVTGEIAESIVAQAKKLHCDEIIMGTRGMGAIANLLLGSVATKVIHLAKVPVTLVK